MKFETWDTVFNIVIFLFWFRIWFTPGRDAALNPYVGGVEKLSCRLVDFLAPVFLGASIRIVAVVAVVFLCLFRAVMFRNVAGGLLGEGWLLEFGLSKALADAGSLLSFVGLSLVSFGIFVFKMWGFALIYVRTPAGQTAGNPEEMLHVLCRPMTSVPKIWRPLVVLILGMAMLFLMESAGITDSQSTWNIHPWPAALGRIFISTLAAWVSVLSLLLTLVMVLIVGSWISMVSSSTGLVTLVREWLDFLMNWFRRFKIQIGFIDLSPIVFFFAVQLAYAILMSILVKSYLSLQPGLSL